MKNILFILIALAATGHTACKKVDPNLNYKDTSFTLAINAEDVKVGGKAAIKLAVIKNFETRKALKVNFTNTNGTLQNSSALFNGDSATTYLVLDLVPGDYVITADIKGEDDQLITRKTIYYSTVADTYTFAIADTAGKRADNKAQIKLVLNKATPAGKPLMVTFTSTKGTPKPGSVTLQDTQAVTYLLLDAEPGDYYITATIKDDSKTLAERIITYTSLPAYPAEVFAEAGTSFFNLTQAVTVKTVLLNDKHTTGISKGLKVNYRAYQLLPSGAKQDTGRLQGVFNIRTGDEGAVPDITFNPDGMVDSTRALYIEASTMGIKGDTIRNAVKLTYKH